MDSGILNALFRDPVINRLTAGHSTAGKANLPSNLVAKVIALKGEVATLRWQGGTITATLNARVFPGETLLLEYSGVRKSRFHYRIMARFTAETDSLGSASRESASPELIGLIPDATDKQNSAPALVRYLPPGKREKQASEERKPIFELFMDTENFGLVLIRFFYHKDDRLECRFIVESIEAGEALQGQADRIIAESAEGSSNEGSASLKWSVGNLRQAAAEVLHQGGMKLNTKA